MATDYERVEGFVAALCCGAKMVGIPMPRIGPALPTDTCDVTDAEEIRINCDAAEGDAAFHAFHVFGHWLCNVHAESYKEPTRPGFEGVGDMVADYIAELILCCHTLAPEGHHGKARP